MIENVWDFNYRTGIRNNSYINRVREWYPKLISVQDSGGSNRNN